MWEASDLVGGLRIIDESFADTDPATSLIGEASHPGTLILKGLGKFWGLAGLRLGFAIGDPALVAQLARTLGPWPVSGPALAVGRAALEDLAWAEAMRARLRREMARLDSLLGRHGARIVGGTSLFRLAEVPEAAAWQEALARSASGPGFSPIRARGSALACLAATMTGPAGPRPGDDRMSATLLVPALLLDAALGEPRALCRAGRIRRS